jgi:hypothetical protein
MSEDVNRRSEDTARRLGAEAANLYISMPAEVKSLYGSPAEAREKILGGQSSDYQGPLPLSEWQSAWRAGWNAVFAPR